MYKFLLITLLVVLVCPHADGEASPVPKGLEERHTITEPILPDSFHDERLASLERDSLHKIYGDIWVEGAVSVDPAYEPPSFDVPVVRNDEVEKFIDYFRGRGRGTFTKWLERSTTYMTMVKDILSEEGLPEDLAYLALIESGFSPYAKSSANALGIWQFMLLTGKHNGLRSDWWVDERHDPELATRAAARHLRRLYSKFDSWYLAAAGYNGGEGRIRRAIKKVKSEDFWVMAEHRRALKRETRNYVPKFLAALLIAKEPEAYGFTDLNYKDPIAYDKIIIERPTDINVIAKAAETTVSEIKRLNPALLRWFTPPGDGGYEIRIPQGSTELFKVNLARIAPSERVRFHTHKVRPGESLYSIARRYKTSIKPIVYLNNIKKKRLIRAGSTLVVPVRERKRSARNSVRAARAGVHAAGGTYIVQTGDTLWDITRRFDLPMKDVLKWNDIDKSDILRPGQRLHLKKTSLNYNTEAGL